MKLEIDHIFILTKPNAKAADALIELGLTESFSRDHKGQGTTNRRFEFSNFMLEFLWIRDENEAINGPGKDLQLVERAKNSQNSPFGLILNEKGESKEVKPFNGWEYQPDFFKAPLNFLVGENSQNLNEPLCIYAPFIKNKANEKTKEKESGLFKSIESVKIKTRSTVDSDVLNVLKDIEDFSLSESDGHVLELNFSGEKNNMCKDFRPELPLVFYW